jgi:hypothetical protein
MADGQIVNYIAQWDGNEWEPLGSGMNVDVLALAASGSNLYAGGYFTVAGNVPVEAIAQWNGSAWSSIGAGMGGVPNYVRALALSGGKLLAAGSFTMAGGSPANRIAEWNGLSWQPLGSGLNGDVFALAATSNLVCVGGNFTLAGNKAAGYVAEAELPSEVAAPFIITTNANFGFINQQFGFDVIAQPGSTLVIEASPNLVNWTPLQTNVVGTSPVSFIDASATSHAARFYRAAAHP